MTNYEQYKIADFYEDLVDRFSLWASEHFTEEDYQMEALWEFDMLVTEC